MENGDRIKIHENIATLKSEMEYVKKQVTNHIPTSIGGIETDIHNLDVSVTESIDGVNLRVRKLESKIAYWSGGLAVAFILIEIFFNFIK